MKQVSFLFLVVLLNPHIGSTQTTAKTLEKHLEKRLWKLELLDMASVINGNVSVGDTVNLAYNHKRYWFWRANAIKFKKDGTFKHISTPDFTSNVGTFNRSNLRNFKWVKSGQTWGLTEANGSTILQISSVRLELMGRSAHGFLFIVRSI